jgi:hypothetical protein
MKGVQRTIDRQDILVRPDLWVRGIVGTSSPKGFRDDVVAEYRELMERGVDMGRLAVVEQHDTEGRPLDALLLVDGFHRFEAMRQLGRTQVDVVVYKGTFDDAVILACELNANRGLRYTGMEAFQVAKAYLKAYWSKGQYLSDDEVAYRLGCRRERVERARAWLAKQDDTPPISPRLN